MQGNREHQPFTGRAEATVTGLRFVKQGAAQKGVVHCGAGEKANGIAKFDAASGEVVTIHGDGDTRLTMSDACSIDDEISSAAAGKGVVSASGDYVLGRALSPALVDGDVIEFRFSRGENVKA